MSSTRDLVLGRVRRAVAQAVELPDPERGYRREGERGSDRCVELLCARSADYRAEVRRTPAAGLREAIVASFAAHAARRIGIPVGLPAAWRPSGLELVEDSGLSLAELDRLDGVLTGCTVAIAETGTIVLAAAPADGRRALTLVPDLHVCVVARSQVVELLPDAMALLAGRVRRDRVPVTFVSGPSATSDIELNRIEGVHGPRRLVVVVLDDAR